MTIAFETVKQAEIKLGDLPELAPVAKTPKFEGVDLDAEHQRLLGWLSSKGLGEWDAGAGCLNTHTAALKRAHEELDLKGTFETLTTESTDRNCFAYPKPKGAWFVGRYGQNVQEAPSWRKSPNGWTVCDFNKKRKTGETDDPAATIVNLATTEDEFFHSSDGQAYVTTKKQGRSETMLVKERSYQSILRMRFTDSTGKVAKPDWLRTAQDQLEAIATQDRPQYPVFVRVGSHGGNVYLDLADAERRVVEITKDGWQLTETSPIRFRRPPTMLPLLAPEKGGSADILRGCFNVRDADWPALLGAMVMCFHPTGPFPVIVLLGRAGSAKSSAARSAQKLIDPTEVDGAPLPKKVEDLMIRGTEGQLLWFDNVSEITQEMSDAICRLTGGAALTRRTLYSNSGETVFRAKRPVIITAIHDVVKEHDLLDRTLRCDLPPLTNRKAESQLNREFESIRAKGLGVLLDGVVTALRDESTVVIDNSLRLLDFCRWATAAESGLGLKAGSFMASYEANQADVRAQILETELAKKVMSLAKDGFEGTASDLGNKLGWGLLSALELRARVAEVRKLAPALDGEGIQVEFLPKTNGKRLIKIQTRLDP